MRPSRLAPALGLAGSVPGSLGVRMAFEPGHGRTAVPVRSALAGTALAVAAVVAAAVFGASFLGLVGTPHSYGQNWTQQLDLQVGSVPASTGRRVLAGISGLDQYAGGNYGQVSVAAPGGGSGTAVPAIGIDQLHGRGFLTLLTGHAPAGPRQITLGPRTLRLLGLHVGQRVRVSANGSTSMHADRWLGGFRGVQPSAAAAPRIWGQGPRSPPRCCPSPTRPAAAGPVTCYNFFLLRYKPGTDLPRRRGPPGSRGHPGRCCPRGLCLVTTDQRPSDIEHYTGVRDTPLVLGVLLGVLAVGTLSHALLAGVRRRYRDLALLKTLGLLRGQLLRVVFWEASTLAGAALLVGLPLGVIAGRWAWVIFAQSAGVAPPGRRAGAAGAAGHPGHPAAGQPHRGRARLDRGPGAGRHRAAERVMGALELTLRAG